MLQMTGARIAEKTCGMKFIYVLMTQEQQRKLGFTASAPSPSVMVERTGNERRRESQNWNCALTRDLVWCECGRGLSLRGVWFFCPTCGRKIDQRSYREAIEEAVNNGAKPFVDGDDAALLQRAEKSEAACAEMQSTLRTSLKIPKAWMRGHITFEQWDAGVPESIRCHRQANLHQRSGG